MGSPRKSKISSTRSRFISCITLFAAFIRSCVSLRQWKRESQTMSGQSTKSLDYSKQEQNAPQLNHKWVPLWFDLMCMNCREEILSVRGLRYFGGWIPHERCGYETLFRASTVAGPCEQIATRPLTRAIHSPESRTTVLPAV